MHFIHYIYIMLRQCVERGNAGRPGRGIDADDILPRRASQKLVGVAVLLDGLLLRSSMLIFGHNRNPGKIIECLDIIGACPNLLELLPVI
jgi:hypothetical protein